MWADESADPPTLFCQVGSTQLRYQLRCVDDLHAWLVEQGDWVDLGAADEQKPAKKGTVEAWGRSEDNPVGGWYGPPERAIAAVSACTCRRCSRLSARLNSPTSRATTRSEPSAGDPALNLGVSHVLSFGLIGPISARLTCNWWHSEASVVDTRLRSQPLFS